MDYYYIYAGEEEAPVYCLILDHNTGLLCAELLEYHGPGNPVRETGTDGNGTGAGTYYGRIDPALAGVTENRYAAAVLEAAKKEGKDYGGYVTHTYAADYDGDSMTEAFVIVGREIRDEYECDITYRLDESGQWKYVEEHKNSQKIYKSIERHQKLCIETAAFVCYNKP